MQDFGGWGCEKSLVLNKPLSVCGNVHLSLIKVCLLIQGLVSESSGLNYKFKKNSKSESNACVD